MEKGNRGWSAGSDDKSFRHFLQMIYVSIES